MPRNRGSRAPWIITALAAVAAAVIVATAAAVADAETTSASGQSLDVVSPMPVVEDIKRADESAPAVPGPAANTTLYAPGTLDQIDVWSVDPALPVDDAPFAPLGGEVAQPHQGGAPIFADPAAEPIGYLPRDHVYGGTTVPVVERHENWVKVLLAGRQGIPPEGNASQVVGWLRTADVELRPVEQYVEVHLEARTIDIVTATGAERVANDFAWGKTSTPTPVGRTFVMLTKVEPAFEYTQGHPLIYLGVQSPTLAGFDGGDVAVTAFHYYKSRSGPNSFGCIYLDGPSTDRLAQAPAGTPVIIHP